MKKCCIVLSGLALLIVVVWEIPIRKENSEDTTHRHARTEPVVMTSKQTACSVEQKYTRPTTEPASVPLGEEFVALVESLDSRFVGGTGFDILAYLAKDAKIRGRIRENGNLRSLVRQRYNLDTPEGIALTLTDISEIIRLSCTEFYSKSWPHDQLLPFVTAVLDEILSKDPRNVTAHFVKARFSLSQGNVQMALKAYREGASYIQGDRSYLTEVADVAHCLLASIMSPS